MWIFLLTRFIDWLRGLSDICRNNMYHSIIVLSDFEL